MISARTDEGNLAGEVVSKQVVPTLNLEPRVVRNSGELGWLESGWEQLASRSGRPMDSFRWAKACTEMSSNVKLHTVVIGGARPTAIAPLMKGCGRGAPLEFLGVNEHFEPMDFLYDCPGSLDQLTDAIAKLGRPLVLKRILADSLAVPALKRSFRGRAIMLCRPVSGTPCIPLDDSWANPDQQLGSSRAARLRRARSQADKMGQVRFDVQSPCISELDELLEEAFRVEAACWKGRAGTALIQDRMRGDFYRSFAASACERGMLRMCFMRIDSRAVAMQIAAESGDRFWLLKIGYDDKFARCSPGMLLMRETVRYAALRGLKCYEFLGTEEPWTKMWTQQARPCISVRIYPATPSGMVAFVMDFGRLARSRTARLRK